MAMPGITGYRGASQVGAGGELTAAEEAWAQAGTTTINFVAGATAHLGDDDYWAAGNTVAAPDVRWGWNTTQTVDAFYLGLSDGQNTFIIAENGDRAFDFFHGAQTNPTLYIQSATQSLTQWLSLTHDQTNAMATAGVGAFVVNAPDGVLLEDSSVVALQATTDGTSATWTAAASDNILINTTTAGNISINSGALGRVGIGILAGANSNVLIGASANDVAGYHVSVGYTDTSTTGTIRALNSEMTANPGGASDASYQSVSINTFTAVGLAQNLTGSLVGGAYFVESRLNAANTLTLAVGSSSGVTNTTGITTTAHGYRAIIVVAAGTVTNGAGFFVRPPTSAGLLVNMNGLDVSDVSLAGGTTAFGVRIQSQTANATTTRAIEIVGTGVNNAIRLGASANIYSSAAETIRFSDSTNANGLSCVLAAGAAQTINTITATTGTITFQNQTFTAAATHNAVSVTPTWVAEDQIHRALNVAPTQNGANATAMTGLYVNMTKATAASVLGTMNGIEFAQPTVAGTVSNGNAIFIPDLTNANITTPRGIFFNAVGVANSIVLAGSTLLYGGAANDARFMDSTNARGISFTMTAAGLQTIAGTTANTLAVAATGGMRTSYSNANVSAPPTDAELDAAFGDPTVVGSGFIGVLDDNDLGTTDYLCFTTGIAGEWFYIQGTKAV